jgi:hypothetical protein
MILVYIIVGLLLFLFGWGIYLTFGPGAEGVRDPIGIAHGHDSKGYVKRKIS